MLLVQEEASKQLLEQVYDSCFVMNIRPRYIHSGVLMEDPPQDPAPGVFNLIPKAMTVIYLDAKDRRSGVTRITSLWEPRFTFMFTLNFAIVQLKSDFDIVE
jgi:hypothetical protein